MKANTWLKQSEQGAIMKRINLIIDALQKAKDGWQCFDEYEKALAAARELKALKPVAWMLPEYGDVISASETDGEGIYTIPLYALDEVTK